MRISQEAIELLDVVRKSKVASNAYEFFPVVIGTMFCGRCRFPSDRPMVGFLCASMARYGHGLWDVHRARAEPALR